MRNLSVKEKEIVKHNKASVSQFWLTWSVKRSKNAPGISLPGIRGRFFDGIVPSLARVLMKQHGIRGGGEYLLKTPENAISETLNFKMSLDATALKNLCLGASSKAAYYS